MTLELTPAGVHIPPRDGAKYNRHHQRSSEVAAPRLSVHGFEKAKHQGKHHRYHGYIIDEHGNDKGYPEIATHYHSCVGTDNRQQIVANPLA